MKTMLRNLARAWANRMLIRSNDTLRRDLIAAEATIERLKQQNDSTHLRLLDERDEALRNVGRLTFERDIALEGRAQVLARALQLEQALVAQSGKGFDEHCADAAGVAGPETSRP